jgi:tRNA (mo5U34)-methyltransferase
MEKTDIARAFREDVDRFNRRSVDLGFPDAANYYWYHTVELPHRLVTPGLYDLRAALPSFPFPADMRGMRVLDVGSATGFFSFEFAKRGAEVVSMELPSLHALDRFPGQNIDQTLEKINRMIVPASVGGLEGYLKRYSAEQLYFYLLEGPFEFCRSLLDLKVSRVYSSVYDISAEAVGYFDLVFLGDILLHTLYPLKALAAAAAVCRGTLVISQVMPDAADGNPAMAYVGGDSPESDEVSWWLPNKPCMIALLKKLGFPAVEETGKHSGVLRPSGYVYERSILRAAR